MSVATASPTTPGAQQVEREVAGAGADLERARRSAAGSCAERLAELAGDLRLADVAVVDAPLRVVVLGGEVVVADVGVADARRRVCMGGRSLVPRLPPPMQETSSETSPRACRRSSSPASGRCPTCRRRTTGSAATWRSTSGSPSAARGLDVVDMACGEGYGMDVLARRAARVTGVDANPEAHEHARAEVHAPGRALRARPGRDATRSRATPSCSSRRSSTCTTPSAVLEHFRGDAAPGRDGRTSRRRTCSRSRRPGREKSDNPWHLQRVPRRGVPRAVRERLRAASSCSASSTRASCARTSWRCGPAGTACTPRSGITKPFYDRFMPAISARDFALRAGPLERALDFVAVLRP